MKRHTIRAFTAFALVAAMALFSFPAQAQERRIDISALGSDAVSGDGWAYRPGTYAGYGLLTFDKDAAGTYTITGTNTHLGILVESLELTLELDNAELRGHETVLETEYGIKKLTLALKEGSHNTFMLDPLNNDASFCIVAQSPLIIAGGGILDIVQDDASSYRSIGLCVSNSRMPYSTGGNTVEDPFASLSTLSVCDGATVRVSGFDYAVNANNISVDNAVLGAESDDMAIFCDHNIHVSGTLYAHSLSASYTVVARYGSIDISDSDVNIVNDRKKQDKGSVNAGIVALNSDGRDDVAFTVDNSNICIDVKNGIAMGSMGNDICVDGTQFFQSTSGDMPYVLTPPLAAPTPESTPSPSFTPGIVSSLSTAAPYMEGFESAGVAQDSLPVINKKAALVIVLCALLLYVTFLLVVCIKKHKKQKNYITNSKM